MIILYLTQQAIGIIKQYEQFLADLLLTLAESLERDKIYAFEEVLAKLNVIIESDFYKKPNSFLPKENSSTEEENPEE